MNIKKKICIILTLFMVISMLSSNSTLFYNVVEAKDVLTEGKKIKIASGNCPICGDAGSLVIGGYGKDIEEQKYNYLLNTTFVYVASPRNWNSASNQITIAKILTELNLGKNFLKTHIMVIPRLNVSGYDYDKKGNKYAYGPRCEVPRKLVACTGIEYNSVQNGGLIRKMQPQGVKAEFYQHIWRYEGQEYVDSNIMSQFKKLLKQGQTLGADYWVYDITKFSTKKKCPVGSTYEGKKIKQNDDVNKVCYAYCPTNSTHAGRLIHKNEKEKDVCYEYCPKDSHRNKNAQIPKGQTKENYCYYHCSDYKNTNFTDTEWDNKSKTFSTTLSDERLLTSYIENGKLKKDNKTLSRAYHYCNIHYCNNPDGTIDKTTSIDRKSNNNGIDTRTIRGIKKYIKERCPNYCPNNTLSYVDKSSGAIKISYNATKNKIDSKCNVINCINTENNHVVKLNNKKIPEIEQLQQDIQNLKDLNESERNTKRKEILKQVQKVKTKYCNFCPTSDATYQIDSSKSGKLRKITEVVDASGNKKYEQESKDNCYKTCPQTSKYKFAKDKNGKSLAGAKIPVKETEILYCYANCPVKPSSQEITQGYVLKQGMENKPIPSDKTRLEYCMTKKADKCPLTIPKEMSKEGYILINAGKTVPKGKQIDTFCYKKQIKCPKVIPAEKAKDFILINAGKIVPQGKTIDNYCYKSKEKLISQYCLDKNGKEIKNKPLLKNGKEVKYTPKELKTTKIQKEIEKLRKDLTKNNYCPKVKVPKKCPNGTRRKGQDIPKGKNVYWCDDHCPSNYDNANEVIPVGQSESSFCRLGNPPYITCEYGSGLQYIKNHTKNVGSDTVEGIYSIYVEIIPVKPQNFYLLSSEEQNYWYQTHKKNETEPIITEYGQFIDDHAEEIRELHKFMQKGGTGSSSNYKKRWNWIVSEARRLRDKVNANPPKPTVSFPDDDTSLGNERGGVYTFTEYRKNAKISSTHYQDYYDMYYCETFYITRWHCWGGQYPGCTSWQEPHNRYAYHSGNHIIDGEYNTGDSSAIVDTQYKPAYSYQSITARCNKQGLESVVNSVGGTIVKSGYISGTGRSPIINGSIASFFNNLPSSFFYHVFGNGGSCEYVFGCTGKENTNASGLNDSSNNKGNTYKTDNNLFGAQAYEHGKENDDTYAKGSSKFTFFRDNQPNKIRNDVWWLDKKINTDEADLDNSNEALATFWTLDTNGTPKKDFFRLEDENHNLITDGNGLQSKWSWFVLSQQNVFYWRSKWASENGKPHKMNIKYAYKPEITTQNPNEYSRDGFNTREDKSAIDMICEVRFNTNKVYKPLIHNLPKEWEYKPFNNFDFTKSKLMEVNFVKSSKE